MTSPDYGTYRFSYTPPNDPNADYPLISIEMSTGGEASVDQMLRFFEAFMAASGFILKGELQVVETKGKPGELTAKGSQGTDFVPFNQYVNDVISFGDK